MIKRKLTLATTILCLATSLAAAEAKPFKVPDLTKGETLSRKNEVPVGPIGITCNIWRPRGGSNDRNLTRQYQIKDVEKGSPADGFLAKDDVILGADGSGKASVPMFSTYPEYEMADAIDNAEGRNPANLNLLIWRKGKTSTVTVKLEHLGSYADTAPYDCIKSKNILRKYITNVRNAPKPCSGGLDILMLLASDDPANPDNAANQEKAKELAHKMMASSPDEVKLGAWQTGYRLISLSEYYLKTKDEAMLPTVKAYAQKFANGQSWFGTTGHRWCDKQQDGSPNGLVNGYGAINASGLGGFMGMILAREAGVDISEVHAAINRADTFFASYAIKSGIVYGEHAWAVGWDMYDMNAKHALAAFAFGKQPKRQAEATWYAKMATASDKDRYYAHAGPFFSQVFDPLGAAIGGKKAANIHFKNIRWHMDLNRKWNGEIIYKGKIGYTGWSPAATQLLTFALPLKNLYLTGRGHAPSRQFTKEEIESIQASLDFNSKKTSTDDLIRALSGFATPVRGKAAKELAGRAKGDGDLLTRLHGLLGSSQSSLERAGICDVLGRVKNPQSVDLLVASLSDPDHYVRFVAAIALGNCPKDVVKKHMSTLLDVVTTSIKPTFPLNEGDPLQLAHGQLTSLICVLLNDGITEVDRQKLWPAIRAMAKTPEGAARSNLKDVYKQLTRDEMLELGETIVESVRVPPPADSMFSFRVQTSGLDLLQKYDMDIAFALIKGLNRPEHRASYYKKYDGRVLELDSAPDIMQTLGNFMVSGRDVSGIVKSLSIKSEKPFATMKVIHSVKAKNPSLRLPTATTELVVDAENFARKNEKDTTYTWRKVYGPGKVSFTPNGSWQKNTTVSFNGGKAGKYRFEVVMTDTLGITAITKAVDVTLSDASGKLPKNTPPVATSQSLKTLPRVELPITLSGRDPDGDELGFIITRQPAHGKLKGFGADRTYIGQYGFEGNDTFAFKAIDGQDSSSETTVTIKVSAQNIGVAIYEGFNYPDGPINDWENGESFGFIGPWNVTKDLKIYKVAKGSIAYPGFPATGGKLTAGKFWYYCSRRLDPDVVSRHKLLEPGNELWFSVTAQFPKGHNFSNFRAYFGLREDVEKNAATDIGFAILETALRITKDSKEVGGTRQKGGKTFATDVPHMIIGHCVWGKTDSEPDTVEIYRVFDAPGMGPMLVPDPVCVIEEVIDQSKINSVYAKGLPGELDEIRIGPTYKSVLLGTIPMEKAARIQAADTKKREDQSQQPVISFPETNKPEVTTETVPAANASVENNTIKYLIAAIITLLILIVGLWMFAPFKAKQTAAPYAQQRPRPGSVKFKTR